MVSSVTTSAMRFLALSMCSSRLSRSTINRMIYWIIFDEAKDGFVLPRTLKSIRRATYMGYGHYLLDNLEEEVVAYVETNELSEFEIVRSFVVDKYHRHQGLGKKVLCRALNAVWQKDQGKPVILACHPTRMPVFSSVGFIAQEKSEAPIEVRAGRDEETWLKEDREWMICTRALYVKATEGGRNA